MTGVLVVELDLRSNDSEHKVLAAHRTVNDMRRLGLRVVGLGGDYILRPHGHDARALLYIESAYDGEEQP